MTMATFLLAQPELLQRSFVQVNRPMTCVSYELVEFRLLSCLLNHADSTSSERARKIRSWSKGNMKEVFVRGDLGGFFLAILVWK